MNKSPRAQAGGFPNAENRRSTRAHDSRLAMDDS